MARRKTAAQIESQYRRLTMNNYRGGDSLSRSQRITQAAKNVRAKNGYSDTGKRTRNMDGIFKNSKNGSLFTVQGGRMVKYKGAAASIGIVAG